MVVMPPAADGAHSGSQVTCARTVCAKQARKLITEAAMMAFTGACSVRVVRCGGDVRCVCGRFSLPASDATREGALAERSDAGPSDLRVIMCVDVDKAR